MVVFTRNRWIQWPEVTLLWLVIKARMRCCSLIALSCVKYDFLDWHIHSHIVTELSWWLCIADYIQQIPQKSYVDHFIKFGIKLSDVFFRLQNTRGSNTARHLLVASALFTASVVDLVTIWTWMNIRTVEEEAGGSAVKVVGTIMVFILRIGSLTVCILLKVLICQ